jgi:mannose-6-phosphate isomerase-like protein (cupin superfamily)
MIVKNNEIDFVSRDNMDIKILTKAVDFENASAALIKVKGQHGKTKSAISDRLYYVVEGEGSFQIEDKEYDVAKGDLIIVPKNTVYDFWGSMSLFLVHVPAFKPE